MCLNDESESKGLNKCKRGVLYKYICLVLNLCLSAITFTRTRSPHQQFTHECVNLRDFQSVDVQTCGVAVSVQ